MSSAMVDDGLHADRRGAIDDRRHARPRLFAPTGIQVGCGAVDQGGWSGFRGPGASPRLPWTLLHSPQHNKLSSNERGRITSRQPSPIPKRRPPHVGACLRIHRHRRGFAPVFKGDFDGFRRGAFLTGTDVQWGSRWAETAGKPKALRPPSLRGAISDVFPNVCRKRLDISFDRFHPHLRCRSLRNASKEIWRRIERGPATSTSTAYKGWLLGARRALSFTESENDRRPPTVCEIAHRGPGPPVDVGPRSRRTSSGCRPYADKTGWRTTRPTPEFIEPEVAAATRWSAFVSRWAA